MKPNNTFRKEELSTLFSTPAEKLLTRRSTKYEPIHGNTWETPPELYSTLDEEFNFVLDAACNRENCKASKGLYYGEHDALTSDWPTEGWIWLNPPYKPIKPWIVKAQEQAKRGCKIVMLIPPFTLCTKYFAEYPPTEIRFLVGRVKFLLEGTPIPSNTRDSVLLIYGGSKTGMSWTNTADLLKKG